MICDALVASPLLLRQGFREPARLPEAVWRYDVRARSVTAQSDNVFMVRPPQPMNNPLANPNPRSRLAVELISCIPISLLVIYT